MAAQNRPNPGNKRHRAAHVLGVGGDSPKLRATALRAMPATILGHAIAADPRAVDALLDGRLDRAPRSARALLARIRAQVRGDSPAAARYRLANLTPIVAFEGAEAGPGDRVRARVAPWRSEAAQALAATLAGRCVMPGCESILRSGRGRRLCGAHATRVEDRNRVIAGVRALVLEVEPLI